MSSIYPEALCIVLLLIGYLYLEEKRIITSSLFIFLAGLCRPEVFAVAVVYLAKGFLEKKSIVRYVVASFVTFSSLIAFMVYSFLYTGSFLTPFRAELLWPRKGMLAMILNVNKLQLNLNPSVSLIYFLLYLPVFVMLLAILCYYYFHPILSDSSNDDTFRKVFPYVLHSTLFFGLISIPLAYLSLARSALFTFPLLWVLSMWCRKRRWLYIVLFLNTALLMMYLSLYVNWYHVN
jgi:hypothetical protein